MHPDHHCLQEQGQEMSLEEQHSLKSLYAILTENQKALAISVKIRKKIIKGAVMSILS